jgi:hypothetical protein
MIILQVRAQIRPRTAEKGPTWMFSTDYSYNSAIKIDQEIDISKLANSPIFVDFCSLTVFVKWTNDGHETR